MKTNFSRWLNHYLDSYRGLPREAWLLAGVMFVNRSGSMVLFFLSLYFTRKLGFTVTQAGQLISLYGLGSLAGSYWGGWLSDKIGNWRVQLWSLLLSGLGFIWIERLRSFEELAVMLIILAVISEALRPASLLAFTSVCPPELRIRGYALSRLSVNLGVAVGPAVGGWLAARNYAYLFWVDGLTCLGAAIAFWFIFRSQFSLKDHHEAKAENPGRSPWRDTIFMHCLLLMLGMGLVFFQIFNTWPLYLKNIMSLTESDIGRLLSINAILIGLVEMPLVHRLEKKNLLTVLFIGSVFMFAGFTALPLYPVYGWAVATVIAWTFGEMLVFPLLFTFVTGRASEEHRGRYIGLTTFTFSLAFVLGPAAGSQVYSQLGPDMLWYLSGIIGLIVLMGIALLNERIKKEAA